MSAFRIGALRHRIVLESATRTTDGGGGAFLTWLQIAELWASITPANGTETVVADQITGRISHEIIVRYRADIAPAMRFRLGSRIFEIVAVLDIGERHRLLRCLCREELL
ncbi:MAG: phage head closure protein [Hyphomicrobiaceae bacterium]